jgi:hypothetical protein
MEQRLAGKQNRKGKARRDEKRNRKGKRKGGNRRNEEE